LTGGALIAIAVHASVKQHLKCGRVCQRQTARKIPGVGCEAWSLFHWSAPRDARVRNVVDHNRFRSTRKLML
jgi:hypothetical protein